jgi:hypothetical protein
MDRIVVQLAPGLGPDAVAACTESVVGQVFFYLTHRPVLLVLRGRRGFPRGFVDAAADRITEFSLGGIERLARGGARRRETGS